MNNKNIDLQVVQKNEFVQKYQKQLIKLTFNDLLVLKTIVSKVNSKDTLFKDNYTVSYAELDKSGFVSNKNRRSALVDSLEKLSAVYFNVKSGEDLVRCGLLKNRFVYQPYSKEFKIEMYPEMSNFLLNIKKQFIKYPLAVLVNLQNKYDLLLFEYFTSISKLGVQKISIESLRELLGVGKKYPRASLLKKELLDKSIERINAHTDIEVSFEPYKEKNKIVGFTFYIKSSENWSTREYLDSILNITLDINDEEHQIIGFEEIQNEFKILYKIKIQNNLGLKGFIQNEFTLTELKEYISINEVVK
jgi:plasmid replication initiation protein